MLMNLSKKNVIVFLSFLINPVLSYIISVYSYLNGKRNSVFVLSLSLSLIFCYFPIMYDTAANFWKVYFNSDTEIFNLYNWLAIYIRGYVDVNFYYFIFCYVFIIFYSWHKSVKYQYSVSGGRNKVCFIIVIIFSLNYRDIMDINRNCYAYSLFLFYNYYLAFRFVNLKKLLLPIFIFISCAIHISAVLLWIVLALVNLKKINVKTLKILLYLSLIIGFFFPSIINAFRGTIAMIGGPLGGRVIYYLYDSGFAVQVFTAATLLKKILNIALIFSIGLLCIKVNKLAKDKMINLILILCSIALVFSAYVTLFERVSLAITLLYCYVVFKEQVNSKLKVIIMVLIISRTVILNLFVYIPIFIGDYNQVLSSNDFKMETEIKPFYYNTFYLFDFDNGYSDKSLARYNVWSK